MPKTPVPAFYHYLDAHELAEVLNLLPQAVLARAKHRPWLLPPRAQLYDRELLRWRQDIVEKWMGRI